MTKTRTLLGSLITFVVIDFVVWELLGTIHWPEHYSFLRPVILAVFVVGQLIVLWKILVGQK